MAVTPVLPHDKMFSLTCNTVFVPCKKGSHSQMLLQPHQKWDKFFTWVFVLPESFPLGSQPDALQHARGGRASEARHVHERGAWLGQLAACDQVPQR